MNTNRVALSISGAFLVLATSAVHADLLSQAQKEIDACTLLTVGDASKALEQTSQPGKRMVESSPTGCIWSADPKMSDSSRRIGVNTHTARAFGFAKSPAITTIKIEPVSGVGDEAFYQLYPNASPFIWVRKGSNAISIRLLGTKTNRFGLEQEKAKELALAKVAVGRL